LLVPAGDHQPAATEGKAEAQAAAHHGGPAAGLPRSADRALNNPHLKRSPPCGAYSSSRRPSPFLSLRRSRSSTTAFFSRRRERAALSCSRTGACTRLF